MKTKYFNLLVLLFFAQHLVAQVSGCTDPLSINFNPQATVNDGSCTYASATVTPAASVNLPAVLEETSGLIKWGSYLYTHNDNTDTNLYALDSITGTIAQTVPISAVTNQDWEDIDQDENFIYLGDFGNNAHGNRANLRIVRVAKASLATGMPVASIINFTYSNQGALISQPNNNTDFDCEAFIVSQDSIYLFTKQWISKKTSLYALPKTPGTHVAQLNATYNVNGLITGAAYNEEKRVVVLSGYSTLLQPFLYLLYDFRGHEFFSGNKRKLNVPLSFHQIEGIATGNGLDFYLTNEKFVQAPFVNVAPKLHRINLAPYLQGYYNSQATLYNPINTALGNIRIYPNPAGDVLFIEGDAGIVGLEYTFTDMTGKTELAGVLKSPKNEIDISNIADGLYYIRLQDYFNFSFKLIKKK